MPQPSGWGLFFEKALNAPRAITGRRQPKRRLTTPQAEDFLKIQANPCMFQRSKTLAAQGLSTDSSQSHCTWFVLQKLKVEGRMCAVNIQA